MAIGMVGTLLRSPAWAGFNVFLKIAGIEGESTDSKHKGEIEVVSITYGAGTALPKVGWIKILKTVDKSSPKLFLGAMEGSHYPTADISFHKLDGGKELFLLMRLEDVVVQSVSATGTGAGEANRPTELVSLSFGKIIWQYTQLNSDGTPGGTVSAGWDLTDNKKI